MNRTRIKICGLTREQDVDAAVAAGVFYGLAGLAGGAVVGLLQASSRELVLAVAGTIALLVQQWRVR